MGLAITINSQLSANRLIAQCEIVMVNMVHSLPSNAVAWKGYISQGIALATLQKYINDSVANYTANLKLVTDFLNNVANTATATSGMSVKGYVFTDFTNLAASLQGVVNTLGSADKSSYAGINSACDAVIAAVPPMPSLWPE